MDEMSTHAAVRLAWALCTPTVVLVAFVVVFAVYYLRIIFVTWPSSLAWSPTLWLAQRSRHKGSSCGLSARSKTL